MGNISLTDTLVNSAAAVANVVKDTSNLARCYDVTVPRIDDVIDPKIILHCPL